MKNKTLATYFVALCSLLLALTMSVRAQNVIRPVPQDNPEAPVVPMWIVQQGQKSVASYLGTLVDHVEITFDGDSIVTPETHYLWREDLRDLGYVHKGSFTELFAATESVTYAGEVVPSPKREGYSNPYDLQVTVVYKTEDGRTLFTGTGSAEIKQEKEGSLFATFDPYVWFSGVISVEAPEGGFAGAKWVSDSYQRGPQKLWVTEDERGKQYINVLTDMLDEGLILVETTKGGQTLTGYSLTGDGVLKGMLLYAKLGKSQSSEIVVLKSISDFFQALPNAYLDGDYFWGYVPQYEFKALQPLELVISPTVGVWNRDITLRPTTIMVKVVTVFDGTLLPGRFELQYSEKAGGWIIHLPAGIYQFEYVIPELHDWSKNPNAKG